MSFLVLRLITKPMSSITIDMARTVNIMTDYEKIMTDPNNIYKGILSAIDGSKWKEKSQYSLNNILTLTFDIAKMLENRTYISEHEASFTLHERGRLRRVDSFPVPDRAIRHVLCDDIFSSKIKNKIIYDNGASVKGRGISHSRKRFEVHLRKFYMRHNSNDGWILFGDFSKYYDNILHDVAKEQLLELVDHDDFINWLLDVIFKEFEIDCSDLSEDDFNKLYEGVFNKLVYDPPKTKNPTKTMKKSISIGDQLSQQIGIWYPHEIDNFIKIVKSQKYYGRYMDDWYIISDSRDELIKILHKVVDICKPIGLHINVRKTHITKLNSIYKYLQVKYTLTSTGKVIKRINPKRVTVMRHRLKKLCRKVYEGTVEYDNVENMFRAWMGSFYKLLSVEQRCNLIKLYEELFNKRIMIYNNKMYIKEDST